MGNIFTVTPFKRRDHIQGQGKDVLIKAKKMSIKKQELNRLYHEFNKLQGTSGYIDLQEFYMLYDLRQSILLDFMMQQFELSKSGRLYFSQYMIVVWNMMTAGDLELAVFIWYVFNPSRSTCIDVLEAKFIIKTLFDFKVPADILKVMNKLDANTDGVVSMAEFILLCRCHPKLLNPVRTIQGKLKPKLVHARYWNNHIARRQKLFDITMPIFNIIDWWDEAHIIANLDWLYEHPLVPKGDVETLKELQRLHETISIEPINLPFELLNAEERALIPFGGGWISSKKFRPAAKTAGFGLSKMVNATKYPKSRYFSGRRPGLDSPQMDDYDPEYDDDASRASASVSTSNYSIEVRKNAVRKQQYQLLSGTAGADAQIYPSFPSPSQ